MSRLVLHIGTHKTGTTSIQRFFRLNQVALADRGVWYPDYSLVGKPPHFAHIDMANALAGHHDDYSADEARAFFAAVKERARDHDVTVLSAEPFYRHVDLPAEAKVPKDPDAYWTARRRYIEKLRDIFGEAQIVVVFRRQADYAQSLYQENVKVTRYRFAFKRFLEDFWYHFAFLDQVRAWEAAFGAPRVLGFERLRETGDIPAAFATALGIDATGLQPVQRQNPALPVDLIVLKRLLQNTDMPRAEARARIDALEEAGGARLRAALARRSYFDGPQKIRSFQQGFEPDNARLAPYVPGLSPDAALFPEEFPSDLSFGDTLCPEFLDFLTRLAVTGSTAASVPVR